MSMRFFKTICFFCLICYFPGIAGIIAGTVTNAQTGKKIPSVLVIVSAPACTAHTDQSGNYSFDSVSPGSHSVLFSHPNYEATFIGDAYVSGEEKKQLDAELEPAAKATPVDRMVVRANAFRRPPDMASSTKIITYDELLRAPGAIMDVQRVVQNLPSVASGGDKTNEIVVRGGVPGENLFLLDNIEIPNPNHFAEQGSGGGVISLVNPLLVKGLTFNAGAPPAQYGGKASSVLDVKLRDGNSDMVLGGVDLGVAGLGFHAEGPMTKQSNFMVSATKSYLDFIANSRFNTEAVAVPKYWGAQARLAYNTADTKVYANGVYGDNSIEIDNADSLYGTVGSTILSGGKVYAVGATWEQSVSKAVSTSFTVSGVGNTFDRLEYTGQDTVYKNTSSEEEQALKGQIAYDFPGNNRLMIGGVVKRANFDIEIRQNSDTLKTYAGPGDSAGTVVYDNNGKPVTEESAAHGADVAYKYGGYISSIVRPASRIRIMPGLRFDAFPYIKSVTVSPRLGASYMLSSALEATAAFGIQYQDPDYADIVKADFNRGLKPKNIMIGIGGLEYVFERTGVKCIIEGYYKKMSDMPLDSSLLLSNASKSPAERFSQSNTLVSVGKGRSYGLELFAQKKLTNEFSWSAAYSLSKSEMQDMRPGHEGEWYRGDYDFVSMVTLSGGWKKELLGYAWYQALKRHRWFAMLSWVMPIGDRNEISAKWRYLGARPHTSPVYDQTYRRWYVDSDAALNADVYGAYHKLDIRWERRFGFGFLQLIYYFDLQNVYGQKNIWTRIYADSRPAPTPVYQLMFFPAGGIILGF